MERNRQIPLPLVVQRIAVISSETAAGLQDFREHLEGNRFGYAFDCRYFTAAVQGKNAETELMAALDQVAMRKAEFDVAVMVRGGGARLDLMTFDSLELCRKAAVMPIPLLTGIGHEVDESVLDMVAHTSLKTPTAVADFLVQHNLFFEGEILEAAQTLEQVALNALKFAHLELDRMQSTLQFASKTFIRQGVYDLDLIRQKLHLGIQHHLSEQHQQLDKYLQICQNLHPDQVLQRGYTLTLKNGKSVTEPSELHAGDLITTLWKNGSVTSRVSD